MKHPLLVVGTFCAMTLSLSACSKSTTDPLQTIDGHRVGKFLVRASIHAENQLKLPESLHKNGYLRCMQGIEPSSTCEKLYASMVDYAKNDPDFRELTVSNLRDMKGSAFWREIREAYDNASFYQD